MIKAFPSGAAASGKALLESHGVANYCRMIAALCAGDKLALSPSMQGQLSTVAHGLLVGDFAEPGVLPSDGASPLDSVLHSTDPGQDGKELLASLASMPETSGWLQTCTLVQS